MEKGPPKSPSSSEKVDLKKLEAELADEVSKQNATPSSGVVKLERRAQGTSESNLDNLLKRASEEATRHLMQEVKSKILDAASPQEKEKAFGKVAQQHLDAYIGVAREHVRIYEQVLAERKTVTAQAMDEIRKERGEHPRIAEIQKQQDERTEQVIANMKTKLAGTMQKMVERLGVSESVATEIMDELMAQERKVIPFPAQSKPR